MAEGKQSTAVTVLLTIIALLLAGILLSMWCPARGGYCPKKYCDYSQKDGKMCPYAQKGSMSEQNMSQE